MRLWERGVCVVIKNKHHRFSAKTNISKQWAIHKTVTLTLSQRQTETITGFPKAKRRVCILILCFFCSPCDSGTREYFEAVVLWAGLMTHTRRQVNERYASTDTISVRKDIVSMKIVKKYPQPATCLGRFTEIDNFCSWQNF